MGLDSQFSILDSFVNMKVTTLDSPMGVHSMSELFVMRRANGNLCTQEINGKLVIPVWSSRETVARYKERNPELMIFLPARLDRSTMKRVKSGLGREGTAQFFLLSEDAPDANLDEGRVITPEEIFPEGQIASPVAQAQV